MDLSLIYSGQIYLILITFVMMIAGWSLLVVGTSYFLI